MNSLQPLLCAWGTVALLASQALALEPVSVRWLDQSPPAALVGSSFGVPFAPGEVRRTDAFSLRAGETNLPLQTWPMAYWPDGSIKWQGFATVPGSAEQMTLTLATAPPPASPQTAIRVTETPDAINIVSGNITYRVPRQGPNLIDSITVDDRVVARGGALTAILEDRAQYPIQRILRHLEFTSRIAAVTLEQQGPVRAVIKIEGQYASSPGTPEAPERAWLPFTVRLYVYAGVPAAKIVHSFIFDGDQEKDFIKGLGLRFTVPMRQPLHNRHVRFAGDQGMFQEPIRVIVGRRVGPDAAVDQVQGQPLPATPPQAGLIAQTAVWDNFKLTQLSPDGYEIIKWTNPDSAPIRSTAGGRSRGLAFLGDTSGGIVLGMKNFWQMYPAGFEVAGAGTDAARMTLWLHSPDAPAMDLRHYDTVEHGLDATYEDITPGFSTAFGIARTHELMLAPFGQVPSAATLESLTLANVKTPQLVCTPRHYHEARAFGVWSLQDKSDSAPPLRRAIEDALDRGIAFYQTQIQQHKWYGFWDFGDVMHAYDYSRHAWRYDIGGYAWANTELMPDMWLWYSFLRTGRADIYRMAEAMTRHTQEVDVYHIGPMKGLGSRHNVKHWGDGAKELRVAQAALKRFYYYLSTDERTGDLLTQVADADLSLLNVNPLRKLPGIAQETRYPTHLRPGPDWFALCSNWLTAHERTEDPLYLQHVKAGVDSFYAMPRKLFSGGNYGYNPATKTVHMLNDRVEIGHLAALMGGPEVWMEFTPVLNDPRWTEMWMQYCRYLQSPAQEHNPVLGGNIGGDRMGAHFAKMTAYAARELKDDALAQRAWSEFLGTGVGRGAAAAGGRINAIHNRFVSRVILPPVVPHPIDEIPGISTNDTAQWSLNAIELLELVGDKMPSQ